MRKILHRYWTEADIASVVEQRAIGRSAATIGADLNRSRNAIYRLYQRLLVAARTSSSVPLRKHNQWTEESIDQLRVYVTEGKRNGEIAVLMNRTYNAIRRMKYELGVSLAKPVIAKPEPIAVIIPAAAEAKPAASPNKPAFKIYDEDEPEFGAHCDLHLRDLQRCRSRWATITAEHLRRSA